MRYVEAPDNADFQHNPNCHKVIIRLIYRSGILQLASSERQEIGINVILNSDTSSEKIGDDKYTIL
ncbi:hypothetical protein CANARDRAFT_26471 [[Candida] arabinofermentans NRRL YB-2248]|uniref:Uncharacterized protein n=1 Tax=[Candida] arabinofermentans NRRL YB-2248 TaxID=983967 RepID=A0A1E4T9I8_9ASCO|nr:hypothetical protein CANARDRAFT_26471 [[Candida] arabinofermentans NRRL YB-2248]